MSEVTEPVKSDKQYKRKLAKEYLGKEISSLQNGEQLPSFRTLIERSGLTRTLIEQAIDYYQQHNLLQVSPRSGIFRTSPQVTAPDALPRLIKIVACGEINYLGNPDGFWGEVLENLGVSVILCKRSIHLNAPLPSI